ncbi:MAG: hypothetical protein IPG11_02005 [Flavobacteriales bacterium]|nr:hypothetical protein [Flavobacteriales bacterium]
MRPVKVQFGMNLRQMDRTSNSGVQWQETERKTPYCAGQYGVLLGS